MSSRFIHVIAYVRTSFLKAEQQSIVCLCPCVCQWPVGFFHFLAVVNNAAWGCEHACKTVLPVLLGIYAEKELLDCLVYI